MHTCIVIRTYNCWGAVKLYTHKSMCTSLQNINYSTEHCYQRKAIDHGTSYYGTSICAHDV